MAERPLEGVRVLELARVLAGPWIGQTLADLGADVIKVEAPEGDETRGWGPPFAADGAAAYFHACNRGKRGIALDFREPGDLALARRLAAGAEVVIENFKVGGLAKFGLDYASVAAGNPGVVYASVTGFGQDGPLASRAGYDFIIQAMGGIMDLTGEPDGPPQKPGVAYADLFTGLYGTVAVLAALRLRDRTGRGQWIDLALFDTQLAVLANQAASHLIGGTAPRRMGNAHPSIVPYQVFDADDAPLVIACGNDGQFARLCAALDLAADPHWATQSATPRPPRRDRRRAAGTDRHAAPRSRARGDAGGGGAGRPDQQRGRSLRRAAGRRPRHGAGDRRVADAAAADPLLRRRCGRRPSAAAPRRGRRRDPRRPGGRSGLAAGVSQEGRKARAIETSASPRSRSRAT